MNIYVFTSASVTNIWAGIGAHKWAVSRAQAANSSIRSKSENVEIGSFGIFYCVETKSLTTPFILRSKPHISDVVRNVWADTWELPFKIIPLGTPNKSISTDRLSTLLPSLKSGNGRWDLLFHFQPITVFAPSQITSADWTILIENLTEA